MPKKRHICHKSRTYKWLMNSECSHPECESGLNAEVHHIVPVKDGGPDEYWNFICLCSKCHRSRRLHSTDEHQTALFTWKCMSEADRFGFYLDEKEDGFHNNLREAILIVTKGV